MSMIEASSRRIDNGPGDPHCIRLSAEIAPRGSRNDPRGWPETECLDAPDRQMRRCRRHRLAQRRIA
jgi:hypothetical protein